MRFRKGTPERAPKDSRGWTSTGCKREAASSPGQHATERGQDRLELDSRVQEDGRRERKAQPRLPAEALPLLPLPTQLPDETAATDHTGKTLRGFIRKEGIS